MKLFFGNVALISLQIISSNINVTKLLYKSNFYKITLYTWTLFCKTQTLYIHIDTKKID